MMFMGVVVVVVRFSATFSAANCTANFFFFVLFVLNSVVFVFLYVVKWIVVKGIFIVNVVG